MDCGELLILTQIEQNSKTQGFYMMYVNLTLESRITLFRFSFHINVFHFYFFPPNFMLVQSQKEISIQYMNVFIDETISET